MIQDIPSEESLPIIITAVGASVLKTEVVDDRWIRYTVKDRHGDEHCVGARIIPVVTSEEYETIDKIAFEALPGEDADAASAS